jgi:arylsulfatase A-like enzyme
VFVFVSDHGEYAGAHGLLSGKMGPAYEECIGVPLIVTDPSGH